jgi:hypothetical protein
MKLGISCNPLLEAKRELIDWMWVYNTVGGFLLFCGLLYLVGKAKKGYDEQKKVDLQ